MPAAIREPGPWTHRNISAGGASFHVALAGEGEHTYVLLHDFPQFWWAWRHQIPALAEAGHSVIAMDLRGFGGSDLQPGQVDLPRLATDVTSVVRTLGADTYTIVGAGMGGAVAWLLTHQQRWGLTDLVTLSAPHPLTRWRPEGHVNSGARTAARHLRSWRRRQRLQSGQSVADTLGNWSGPEHHEQQLALMETYAPPMRRHFAAEAALNTWHATISAAHTAAADFETPISVPVVSIHGAADPLIPVSAYAEDASHTRGGVTHKQIVNAGRYLAEESPNQVTRALLQANPSSRG